MRNKVRVKWSTLVEGDPKGTFSIAATTKGATPPPLLFNIVPLNNLNSDTKFLIVILNDTSKKSCSLVIIDLKDISVLRVEASVSCR